MYLGDFKEDGDVFFKFTSRAFATGIPTQLAGTPVLSIYIDEADGTEKTTAESYFDLDVDFDGITGLNNVRINLNGDAFFAAGADYTIVITTGTVGGVSVVGEVVATLSIENRFIRGTDSAALAAVCTEGRLAELDPANLPTDIAAVPTAAENKTAMEADGSDLSSLMEALVNKLLITEASGNAEVFNDAGVSQGTVAAAFTSVAGVTQRKRMFI